MIAATVVGDEAGVCRDQFCASVDRLRVRMQTAMVIGAVCVSRGFTAAVLSEGRVSGAPRPGRRFGVTCTIALFHGLL